MNLKTKKPSHAEGKENNRRFRLNAFGRKKINPLELLGKEPIDIIFQKPREALKERVDTAVMHLLTELYDEHRTSERLEELTVRLRGLVAEQIKLKDRKGRRFEELDAKIKRMKNDIEKLGRAKEVIQTENERLQKRMERKQKEVDELRWRKERLKTENTGSKQKKDELEEEKSKTNEKLAKTTEEIEAIEAELKTLNEEIGKFLTFSTEDGLTLDETDPNIDTIMTLAENDLAGEEVRKLKEEIKEKTEQLGQLRRWDTELRTATLLHDDGIRCFKGQIEQNNRLIGENSEIIEGKRRENTADTEKIQANNDKIIKYEETITDYNSKITEVEQEITALPQTIIDERQKTKQEIKEEVGRLREEIQEGAKYLNDEVLQKKMGELVAEAVVNALFEQGENNE